MKLPSSTDGLWPRNAAGPQSVPQLLVSVRSGSEALAALAGGADVVDVKEPLAGPLGQPTLQQVSDVLRAVDRQRPVSVALGDLPAAHLIVPDQVDFVKVGLAQCGEMSDWQVRWEALWRTIPTRCLRIAVIYADWESAGTPRPRQILDTAQQLGCRGLLVDTYEKQRGSLFDLCRHDELQEWLTQARQWNWLVALAGSLGPTHMLEAVSWNPDVIGVRGAVCANGRNSTIDPHRVTLLKSAMRHLQYSHYFRENGAQTTRLGSVD